MDCCMEWRVCGSDSPGHVVHIIHAEAITQLLTSHNNV